MAKHTPGPWRAAGFDHPCVITPAGETVAFMLAASRDLNEADANARLIAAAPELLAALREIARTAHAPRRTVAQANAALDVAVDAARAAIRKATGEV